MRTLSIVIVLAMAGGAGAGTRVVAMVDPDDVGALRVALAGREVDLAVAPAPDGDLRLDRAAAAQRSALDQHADAAVWIETDLGTAEVCVVPADGRRVAHAPLPIEPGSSRVFAAIAASLLDEVLAPPAAVSVGVQVDVTPPAAATPAIAAVAPAKAIAPARFMIDAGGYLSRRGMVFDGRAVRSSYPSSAIDGVRLEIAAFPLPIDQRADRLTGPGVTASLVRSLGATLTGMDNLGTGEYELDHAAWQLAAHYRYPVGIVTIDGAVELGNIATQIIDLPSSIEIPDTSYAYVGGGLHVDLAVAQRASVGFGAHYMSVVTAGDVNSEDWFGAGTTHGYAFDADFVVPVSGAFYLKGAIEYRVEHLDFVGTGAVTMSQEISSIDDRTIAGSASAGLQF